MTIYQTSFIEKLGDTDEIINVTIEYCDDLNGDGYDDIKITLSLDPSSNSGTEDMLGVAFDIQNDAVAGLEIINIQTSTSNGTLSTYVPTYVIGANQVSDGGPKDPGFNTSGGGSDEPYDIGIKFSDQGSGEGIVQTASFIITSAGADLDAEALLENTDWWVRLQSTDGGEGSAKTGGFILDLPPCFDQPPFEEPGTGNTPGFWKNHAEIFLQETDKSLGDSYEDLFLVDVTGSTKPFVSSNPTLGEALGANGGGEAALLRASTAGWANAVSDDVNYVIDEDALLLAAAEKSGLAPGSPELDAYFNQILGVLNTIDLDDDGSIEDFEIINAVQDVYDDSDADTDYFSWANVGLVANALDTMNNMPSVEVGDFLV